jgi:hypothetical protein
MKIGSVLWSVVWICSYQNLEKLEFDPNIKIVVIRIKAISWKLALKKNLSVQNPSVSLSRDPMFCSGI